MSIQIHTATREESNNRAMLAPESKTKSGIVLRGISLGSLEILRQPANPLSSAEERENLSAVDTRVLAEFLWVHGAPIEEVLDTVYNTPTQVAVKAAAFALQISPAELRSITGAQAEKGALRGLPPDVAKTKGYGLTSTQSIAYTSDNSMARLHTETIPTSTLAATERVVDGFVTTQTDHSGITSSFTRAYTVTGVTLTATDGRGNTTTSHTGFAGRTMSNSVAPPRGTPPPRRW